MFSDITKHFLKMVSMSGPDDDVKFFLFLSVYIGPSFVLKLY